MLEKYRFEVYTDETDSGELEYIVKFFDFDNIIGVGETINEALEEAKSNLAFYIKYCEEKNIKVPEPSTHVESSFSGKVTLRMSKSLHKLVDEVAKNEGVSINAFLNEAVSSYVSSKCNIKIISEKMFDKVVDNNNQ